MFEDRKETQNILDIMMNTSDYFQVINHFYPDWIISMHDSYANEYFFMDANWKSICNMLGVEKKQIILVSDIFFDDDHKDMMTVCEFLTKQGYCVRRRNEFVICDCNKLILERSIWEAIKQRGNVPISNEWKDKCSNC